MWLTTRALFHTLKKSSGRTGSRRATVTFKRMSGKQYYVNAKLQSLFTQPLLVKLHIHDFYRASYVDSCSFLRCLERDKIIKISQEIIHESRLKKVFSECITYFLEPDRIVFTKYKCMNECHFFLRKITFGEYFYILLVL